MEIMLFDIVANGRMLAIFVVFVGCYQQNSRNRFALFPSFRQKLVTKGIRGTYVRKTQSRMKPPLVVRRTKNEGAQKLQTERDFSVLRLFFVLLGSGRILPAVPVTDQFR